MVRCDLFDMDRRREFVEGKMAWVDNLDPISGNEPHLAVGGLRDPRSIVAGRGVERSLTPSGPSRTVVSIVRFGSAIHASNSAGAMRTRPQAVYNQNV